MSQPGNPSGLALPIALRVPAFTVGTVWLGVTAHVAASGARPGWGTISLLTLTVAIAARASGRREFGPRAMCVAVASAQVLVHVLLAVGHPAMAAPTGTGSRLAPGVMLAGHLAAAAAMAAWLRRGEAAAWSAARRAAIRLRRRCAVQSPAAIPGWRTPRPRWVSARGRRCRLVVVRAGRGPPAGGHALAA